MDGRVFALVMRELSDGDDLSLATAVVMVIFEEVEESVMSKYIYTLYKSYESQSFSI